MTYEDLKDITEGLILRTITPIASPELPRGSFDWLSFPFGDFDVSDSPMVHFYDVITGYSDPIDWVSLGKAYKDACEKHDLQLLPQPFGLKKQVSGNVQLQMVILKDAAGNHAILKHLAFPDKIKPSMVKQLVFGDPRRAKWMQQNPKIGRKVLQYCLEGLGGRQFKAFELSNMATRKGAKTSPFDEKGDAEIDAGFDFILKCGPRSSSENQQLRWQTKTTRDPNSPIYGWPTGLVDKALRNLASDGALARKEFDWPIPLSLRYYQPWLLNIVEQIWDFDQSALLLLGEAGVGKSPLGRSVLMAQARHNKTHFQAEGSPCIRCTPEIDFLRGEAGSIIMGDFLDDTSLATLSMKMVKAFLDVGLYESMAWARWGATKWVQNEPRAVADNTYDEGVPLPPSFIQEVSFETFWKIIRPAFTDQASHAHMDAIFKRAAFLVNSKEHLYYRPSGINTNPVNRISMPICEYLTEDGKQLYGKFKNGNKDLPEDWEVEIEKEQEWVHAIMTKRYKERKATKKDKEEENTRAAIRHALWGERPSKEPSVTEKMEALEQEKVQVKRELAESEKTRVIKKAKAWSQQLRASHTVIDLDSNSEAEERPAAVPSAPSSASAPCAPLASEEHECDGDVSDHGFGMEDESK